MFGRLKTCKVLELTQYTAKIMEMPYSHLQPTLELGRIRFIEKVEEV